MIHEEDPAEVEEVPAVVDGEDGVEDVYGEAPPPGEYSLSTRR
ncbi:hypothetical protein [Streptomyces griseorubiginosus]